jgi:hypothetical protein
VRLYFEIVDTQVSQPQLHGVLISPDDDTDHLRWKSSGCAGKEFLVSLLETKHSDRIETEDAERFVQFEIAYRILDDICPSYVTALPKIHEKFAGVRICATTKLILEQA